MDDLTDFGHFWDFHWLSQNLQDCHSRNSREWVYGD